MNSEYNWAASVLLCDMTSTGRCTSWITLAIVKVLPEPVTPISTWCFFAAAQPFGQGLDGLGLIAGGLEGGNELEHALCIVDQSGEVGNRGG